MCIASGAVKANADAFDGAKVGYGDLNDGENYLQQALAWQLRYILRYILIAQE